MPTPVLRRLAIEDLRALVQGILAFDRAVRELAEGPSKKDHPGGGPYEFSDGGSNRGPAIESV